MAKTRITKWTRLIAASLCGLALLLSATVAQTGHVPKVLQVLEDHAEMIADHGHSHGLEEDLAWAIHGHSHDKTDHDHSQAVLIQNRALPTPTAVGVTWHAAAVSEWSPPVFRMERPPRA